MNHPQNQLINIFCILIFSKPDRGTFKRYKQKNSGTLNINCGFYDEKVFFAPPKIPNLECIFLTFFKYIIVI